MRAKVLIIDDELDSVRLIGYLLESEGYKIVAALNGERGIEKALAETPDLVILDVMMPGMDGYEVCRRLRSNPQTASIPILMFTAKSQLMNKVIGFESGADEYLTKPIRPAELLAGVERLLARTQEGD
jgi:DNA-binding response OmpR family regulator